MKPILTLALAALASSPASPAEDIVRFFNNDQLTGNLESLTPDTLVWESPAFEKATPLFLKNVIDITLPGSLPDIETDHDATLTLTNGDTAHGRLASVTDQIVSLDTAYAGRMAFNRLMVSGVNIEGQSAYLYRGPDGLDGWTQSADPPAWQFTRSSFQSHEVGSIAKDDLLPDQCSVKFDVAWRGDSIALKVILFSADASTDSPTSGYELAFQRGSVYLRSGRTQNFLGSTHSQVLMENDKVRMEIRASRTSGKICLFINDTITEVWSDPDLEKGRFGSSLHFVSQNPLPMRISRIGVSTWNGQVEQMPEPRVGMIRQFGLQPQDEDLLPAPQDKPEENRMLLANGDSLTGEVTSIEEGHIHMNTPLGDIKVPVSRLRTVALKKVDLERAIRRNGDVRASLPDGTSLVFKLESLTGDTLTGSSQNFGTASFKLSSFSRIEFNIYDVALEEIRLKDEW